MPIDFIFLLVIHHLFKPFHANSERPLLEEEAPLLLLPLIILFSYVAKHCHTTTVVAYWVPHNILNCNILNSKLVIFLSKHYILVALQLVLHLGSPILKPELHLSRLQAELPIEVQPLFIVRVRPFLEASFKLINLLLSMSMVLQFLGRPLKYQGFLLILQSTI